MCLSAQAGMQLRDAGNAFSTTRVTGKRGKEVTHCGERQERDVFRALSAFLVPAHNLLKFGTGSNTIPTIT